VSAAPTERFKSVDATASTLNHLIQTCIEGENGFRSAAAQMTDLNLKRLFESYSQQRAEFAAELQEGLSRHGQEPSGSGDGSTRPHPGLPDVDPATGKDEGAVISECERAEDVALKAYETALTSDLPNELRSTIERQFARIKEAHDQVRSLERAHDRHN
jgi:uncharacterized protein (TIGR02284 family)